MSDDIFDLPQDDEETPEAQPERRQDNQAAAAQRKLAKAEKELEELRAFKAEREKVDRQNVVKNTFSELGLQPEWAEFYADEEVTPESVKQWAVTKKLLQGGDEEPEPEAPAPSAGFTPTVIDGGNALGSKVYTFEEYEEVRRADPAKADQLRKAGRVQKEVPSWTVLEG